MYMTLCQTSANIRFRPLQVVQLSAKLNELAISEFASQSIAPYS